MTIIPCPICPNGCPLEIHVIEGTGIKLSGHSCGRGMKYIQGQFSRVKVLAKPFRPEIPEHRLNEILEEWSISLAHSKEIHQIPGSPERSLGRWAFKTLLGNVLLELFSKEHETKKMATAQLLWEMKNQKIPVTPPLRNNYNQFLLSSMEGVWQLTPLVQGVPLRRNDYWQNTEMGGLLGSVQGRIHALHREENLEPFCYGEFLQDLWFKIGLHEKQLYKELRPLIGKIENPFFLLLEKCPREFCHGDPHPMNVLWGKNKIEAIIDWEFCGQKPLLYDAALTMGCVGSEDPQAYSHGFNQGYIKKYKQNHPSIEPWLDKIDLFVLGLRFAWLNEWLRHKDQEMTIQELQYMKLLAKRVCA